VHDTLTNLDAEIELAREQEHGAQKALKDRLREDRIADVGKDYDERMRLAAHGIKVQESKKAEKANEKVEGATEKVKDANKQVANKKTAASKEEAGPQMQDLGESIAAAVDEQSSKDTGAEDKADKETAVADKATTPKAQSKEISKTADEDAKEQPADGKAAA